MVLLKLKLLMVVVTMVKQFVRDGKIRVIRTGEIFTVRNISPEDEMCWRVNVQESDTYFYDYEVEIL